MNSFIVNSCDENYRQAVLTLQSCFRTAAAEKRFSLLRDSKKELERGIEISPEILSTIQSYLPKILSKKDGAGYQRYKNCSSVVFSLIRAPHLIFKTIYPAAGKGAYETGRNGYGFEFIPSSEMIPRRFANMIQAQVAIRVHYLNRLILPHAKMFRVTVEGITYAMIAEQRLDLVSKTGIQEELYFSASEEFDPAVCQLVHLMKEVGFSDAEWRNIPILKSFDGKAREIGLVDLEHVSGIEIGICGDEGKQGLIRSVSKRHIDLVIQTARNFGVDPEQMEKAKEKRLEAIEEYEKLRQFHEERGILQNPVQTIEDDIVSLGLDPNQTSTLRGDVFTLREVSQKMFTAINSTFLKQTEEMDSVKDRRKIFFSRNNDFLWEAQLPTEKDEEGWMTQICRALVKYGRIFSFTENGHGFFLQA